MELNYCLNQMANQLTTIVNLTNELSEDQARWKPDPDSWSVLEVINHLYDEEMYDFRVRLDIVLRLPGQPWPPIDPQGWVEERKYNEKDLTESVSNFVSERRKSLEWLESLGNVNWDTEYDAPWGSTIRAGDMFAAWVGHDLLHTRQLVELRWLNLNQVLSPYDMRYAGEW